MPITVAAPATTGIHACGSSKNDVPPTCSAAWAALEPAIMSPAHDLQKIARNAPTAITTSVPLITRPGAWGSACPGPSS